MLTYNVHLKGEKIDRLAVDIWRVHAPSARLTDKFSDESVNVEVRESESDALTDYWDKVGFKYHLV